MILHIDMDAFFASIEQAINPKLRGKPLIVGSRGNKLHTVVCAASYQAKALGISSGMPTHEALKICPQLKFVAAQQSKYIWTSEQIFQMLKEYGFEIVYASIDEFRLDIKNLENPAKLAQEIQAKIAERFNITASVGIAKNCLLAKLGSKLNKPNGIALINEDNLEAILKKTPVEKLSGVGPSTQQTMYLLGIKTCLDLYQKTARYLERIFGQNGLNLYLSLHSQESLDLALNEEKPKSIGHSYTLPRASENTGFIQAWMRLLSEMVGERLRQNGLSSQAVFLWLNGPQTGNFTCQKTFQQPTNDSYEIYQRSLKIMAQSGLKMPKIRALGITCSKLSGESYPPLFKEQKRREDLIKTLDRLNQKLGDGTIFPASVTLTKKMP